jgi:ribose transport system permease protein
MLEALKRARAHPSWFVFGLTIALFVGNVLILPRFAAPSGWMGTLAGFAPFALVAVASTPAILSGGGGIDISVAATMNLVNVVFVVALLPHGLGGVAVAVPLMLIIGATVGLCNGVVIAVLRYQPVIATISAFFIVSGISLQLATTPVPAPSSWIDQVGTFPWPLVLIGAPIATWMLLSRTAYLRNLLLVGSDPAAAFSAGISVSATTIIAYTLGGLFAAVAGIALTGVLRSADSSLALQYALIGIAAVVIGGTPLGGGRGSIVGSMVGAALLYLLQNLITELNVSQNWVQLVYGVVLMAAVLVASSVSRSRRMVRG